MKRAAPAISIQHQLQKQIGSTKYKGEINEQS